MTKSANITEEVLKAENKYLTKIIGWSVGALITTLVFIGGWQITVLNELVKKVDESNIANNNRFNTIESRITLSREKGGVIVDGLRKEDDRLNKEIVNLWKAIEELRK